MRLKAPRLLSTTIGAMAALLVVKSIMLMQAAAEEPAGALAAQAAPLSMAAKAAEAEPAKPAVAAGTMASGAAQPPPMSESERGVLLSLRERRAALDARARSLDQRAAELEAADKRLEQRVGQLTALQTRLEGLEAGRQARRAENWTGLVKTYEAMKPREAAAIFDVLDMQVLLQVLDRMQERRAAPVLAAMQPDRARLATQLLAEMRTRATAPPEQAASVPTPKG